MAIQSYRELRIYTRAVELRQRVFSLSASWPKDERYALTGQIRRSSRSIGAAIAEAWSKRRFERHFVSKLTDAHAEAAETSVWLDVAIECGYVSPEEHGDLGSICNEIGGGLVKMMRESHKWTVPDHLVREEDLSYDDDPPSRQ